MGDRVQEIRLPDGTPVLARLTVLDDIAGLTIPPFGPGTGGENGGGFEGESGDGEGAEDERYDNVGALDVLSDRVEGLGRLVTGIGTSVRDAAMAARPDEISAEFGIELALKPNKVIAAVLADGEATASITVTLTWQLGAPADD
jgi:hypothetical protein